MYEGKRCRNCDALLLGPYCHQCGQQHSERSITTREYIRDVAARVYRFDGAFWRTIRQSLASPGALADDYLSGRRRGILDPVRYFSSSIFVQFVIVWLSGWLARQFDQPLVLNWLDSFIGFAAIRFLFIFWFGSLWYFLFPPKKRQLGEIYVFATYAFATAGLLWVPLPLLELLLPGTLGVTAQMALSAKVVIEGLFLVYAVTTFAHLPVWSSLWRAVIVLSAGVGLIVLFRRFLP